LASAAVLVALLSGCGGGPPDLEATVTGLVQQGPTCPVETLDSPCPPAPAVGARVEVVQEGTVVTSTTTDADGRFELAAPVGSVEVRAESTDGLPSQDVQTFTLDVGDLVDAELMLDTGIR
jgi:hypothetical protein